MTSRALAARGGRGAFISPSSFAPLVVAAGAALVAATVALPVIYFVGQHPRALPGLALGTPVLALMILRPRWIVPVFLGYIWSALPPDFLGGIPSPADMGSIVLLAVSAYFILREPWLGARVAVVYGLIGLSIVATGLVAVGGPTLYIDGLKDLLLLVIAAFCIRTASDGQRFAVALCVTGFILGAGSAFSVLAHPFGPFQVVGPAGPLDPTGTRAAGLLYGDANFFALSLATIVPFALFLIGRGGRQAWVGGVSMAGLFAGILATGSRGGLLAAVIAGLVWAFTSESTRMKRASVATVVCLIALTPLFSAQLSPSRDVTGRLNENRIAIAMFADHPVAGVGPQVYPDLFRDYSRQYGNDPRYERPPHSLPLEIASEQGLVGILAWIVAGVFVIRFARRYRVWGIEIGRAVCIALITYLVGSIFLHGSQLKLPYILVGLIFALGASRASPERSATA
jgi:hypothetical protein